MARDGGVRGEKRCEGREKWEMKRKKEKETCWGKKIVGKLLREEK